MKQYQNKLFDATRYTVIETYNLPFYLQIGFLCSSVVIHKNFNPERLEGFTFPDSIPLYNNLNDIPEFELDSNVVLALSRVEISRNKIGAIQVSRIEKILCKSLDFEQVAFILKSNDLAYTIELEVFRPSPEKGIASKLNFLRSEKANDLKLLSKNLRVKGGLALLFSFANQTDEPFVKKFLLSETDFAMEFFEETHNSRALRNQLISGVINPLSVIKAYTRYLKLQYGNSSIKLRDFLQDQDQRENVQHLFFLTKELESKKSNFSFLQFAFIANKYSKLDNVISKDVESALFEVILGYNTGSVGRKNLLQLFFLFGYFSGYGNLFPMNFDIPDAVSIKLYPKLDDAGGLGLALDQILYESSTNILIKAEITTKVFAPVNFQMQHKDLTESQLPDDEQLKHMLNQISLNPVQHKKIAILHVLFDKLNTEAGEHEFYERLKNAEQQFFTNEPHFAHRLEAKIEGESLSENDLYFLRLILKVL
jgi:hypothetical protein